MVSIFRRPSKRTKKKMIGDVIRLLQTDDFKKVSKRVEIAKGKYQLVKTWKQFKRKIKR